MIDILIMLYNKANCFQTYSHELCMCDGEGRGVLLQTDLKHFYRYCGHFPWLSQAHVNVLAKTELSHNF
jgi:hypothetical protein